MKLTRNYSEYSSIPYHRLDEDSNSPLSSSISTYYTFSICKLLAPITFAFLFFIFYMNIIGFNVIPHSFSNLRIKPYLSIYSDNDFMINETNSNTFETTIKLIESIEIETTTETITAPNLRKRAEVKHIDCGRLLNGDKEYMKEIAKNRPKLVKTNINMNCSEIWKRIIPARNPNTGFPILYARIVHTDYEFLEDLLATDYAEENLYCYAIDSKAGKDFHYRMQQLSHCIPNVVIPKIDEKVDGYGHNQNRAHMDCMELVNNQRWKYAILLQNHDVMIKTHEEITEILTIYGGANDVEITPCSSGRCKGSLEKNLAKLGLCPKSLSGIELQMCQNSSIEWGKGAMQVILSREAVDYMFNEIDIKPLMEQFNHMGFGVDEELYQSLQITEQIRLPGGFTHKCREKKAQYISRKSKWTGNTKDCSSGYLRHYICVYGIEDLLFLSELQPIMANKIMPDFDIGIASCVSELLWNRTRGIIDHPIDKEYYANINTVRYNRERKLANFSIDSFQCEINT